MPAPTDEIQTLQIKDVRLDDFAVRFPLWSTIRVLVVADTSVQTSELDGFGVGRFIELLRGTKLGCNRFVVDVARRDVGGFNDAGPGAVGDRYQGFRFNSLSGGELVIDRYHEIFMFGFAPGNDDGPDGNIDGHPLFMDDDEKAAIDGWMDEGGGVFATGDHDYLGATMCHRITRVGAMRKWTNADGVPPRTGPDRIDAHRPDTMAERLGTALIVGAETDSTPQPIEWVAVSSHKHGLFRYRRPHEVLCHPTHGPIDVMPDHNHEGLCFTPAEIQAGGRRAEFPGNELPQIIAWGNTLADPPLQHLKGDSPAKHFPMISVYNGWNEGDPGRIVVDSTWHHWFNMNLDGLEAAGGEDWDKVARYFINVAKWIAPKGVYRSVCWWDILVAHFSPRTIEDLHPKADIFDLGSVLYGHLAHIHGPCTVREFVFDWLCTRHPELCGGLRKHFLQPLPPEPNWALPHIEVIEHVLLGGMARGTMRLAERIRSTALQGRSLELSIDQVEKAASNGAEKALATFAEEATASAREVADMFASVQR